MLFGIRYASDSDQDKWLTLDDIREELPKSAWRHTGLFETIGVAIKMNMPPTRFWAMPEEDKAYIIAYHRAISAMQEYERKLSEREAARHNKPKAKK